MVEMGLAMGTAMDVTGIKRESTLRSMLRGLCPRCRQGLIYPGSFLLGLGKMRETCPCCGLKFEREQGYFLGAMMISYMLAVPVMGAFLLLFWWLTRWSVETLILVSVLGLLPFTPMLARLSRVLWIYFDRKMDPE